MGVTNNSEYVKLDVCFFIGGNLMLHPGELYVLHDSDSNLTHNF